MAVDTLALLGAGAVLLLLCLSAFFSSVETAIFSLSLDWIDTEATAGDRSARTLQRLRNDPHRLLVTVLVGNNLVNVAISSIVTALIATVASAGIAVVLATVVVSGLILIFGEIVPKSYGLGNAEGWALRTARPIALVEKFLSPVVWVFDVITRRITGIIQGNASIEEPYLD
ncbi:MAG: DUF21 domain-containing protein [Halobacteriales archaeon]|nr:DUF21 domain-containing protein [Halobacteriales archaeon]